MNKTIYIIDLIIQTNPMKLYNTTHKIIIQTGFLQVKLNIKYISFPFHNALHFALPSYLFSTYTFEFFYERE